EFGLLNSPVDMGGECPDGLGAGRDQGLLLDVGQLVALGPKLRQDGCGGIEKPAAESGVSTQPADQRLHVAVRHAGSYCGSRSASPQTRSVRAPFVEAVESKAFTLTDDADRTH